MWTSLSCNPCLALGNALFTNAHLSMVVLTSQTCQCLLVIEETLGSLTESEHFTSVTTFGNVLFMDVGPNTVLFGGELSAVLLRS